VADAARGLAGRGRKGARAGSLAAARGDAERRREATLLEEYKALGGANVFDDRRILGGPGGVGGGGAAVAAFRAERRREQRQKLFALTEEEGPDSELLTHGGVPLGEAGGFLGSAGAPEEGDDGGFLEKEMTQQLHFGGGEGRRKSKREAMAELIAKSKAFRAERARQKETDLDILDDVDAEFADIRRNLQLAKGREGGRGAARLSSREAVGDEGFDAVAAGLNRGGRGRAGDALPTPEELAEQERKRLETLEQLRLKRAREETRDPTAEERLEGIGGYRGRRLRQKLLNMDEGKEGGGQVRAAPAAARDRRTGPVSGDALEEDDWEGGDDSGEGAGDESEEDEDVPHHLRGLSDYGGKLQRRQAEQAKGDHPLQVAFRETMGKVMEKYGLAEEEARAGEDSDDNEDDSGEEEEEEEEKEEVAPKKGSDTGRDAMGKDLREEKRGPPQPAEPNAPAGAVEAPRPAEKVRPGGGKEKEEEEEEGALPFVLPAPKSYAEFRSLVEDRGPEELAQAVQRIRACNAPELMAGTRRGLQEFYGIVAQHFASLAAQKPVPLQHLDALVQPLLDMSKKTPLYAATVARARLERMSQRLDAALQAEEAADLSPWPTSATLMQLQLWSRLFPATDLRHAVVTGSHLFFGKALALCPLRTTRDSARALVLLRVTFFHARAGQRFFPEVLPAFPRILCALAQEGGGKATKKRKGAESSRPSLEFLLEKASSVAEPLTSAATEALAARSCLREAAALLEGFLELWAPLPSYPELADGLTGDLEAAAVGTGAEELFGRARQLLAARRARTPLVIASRVRPEAPKALNPAFEENFQRGKDYDVDRERAEQKRLKRALKKESRGAVRELRKDARFMARVQAKERQKEREELEGNYRRTFESLRFRG